MSLPPRYRSLFTGRERELIDHVLAGRTDKEIGRLLKLSEIRIQQLIAAAARKIPGPPRDRPRLRLVIWRAKQIGAVEAHLGLRDLEGNHIDDGTTIGGYIPVDGIAEHDVPPDTVILAPRILRPRPKTPSTTE